MLMREKGQLTDNWKPILSEVDGETRYIFDGNLPTMEKPDVSMLTRTDT